MGGEGAEFFIKCRQVEEKYSCASNNTHEDSKLTKTSPGMEVALLKAPECTTDLTLNLIILKPNFLSPYNYPAIFNYCPPPPPNLSNFPD